VTARNCERGEAGTREKNKNRDTHNGREGEVRKMDFCTGKGRMTSKGKEGGEQRDRPGKRANLFDDLGCGGETRKTGGMS